MKDAVERELNLGQTVELAVLAVKKTAANCRLVGTDRAVTLRTTRQWDIVPGEIALVKPNRQWTYAGHPCLSGEILSARLDPPALGLVPLRLESRDIWLPEEHYWGEEDEPIEAWATPIMARGPREAFEMEQVIPGQDPDDFDTDPICEASDLKDAGQATAAIKILMELCQADLRCLDAHAHLGNFRFDRRPEDAFRHYRAGVGIGELSLPAGFDGLLPWGHIDNRPFLRRLHGQGLCLWRLKRFGEAGRIFERMLWLNPSDNQGARFLIGEVSSKTAWEDSRHSV